MPNEISEESLKLRQNLKTEEKLRIFLTNPKALNNHDLAEMLSLTVEK